MTDHAPQEKTSTKWRHLTDAAGGDDRKALDTKRAFRNGLGAFPTGICVMTAAVENELLGMTMSSFNSLSLDPPLVLFSITKNAKSHGSWVRADKVLIHVLEESQTDLSNRFARSLGDKWDGIDFAMTDSGLPLLEGTAAVYDCKAYAAHDGGDHTLFLVKVQRFQHVPSRRPLLFAGGAYGKLADERGPAADWPLHLGW